MSLELGFEVSDAQPIPNVTVLFLLPPDLDVELSATSPAACPPACSHAFCHDDNGLTLGTVSQPQLNVFLYKSCCGHGVSSQQ